MSETRYLLIAACALRAARDVVLLRPQRERRARERFWRDAVMAWRVTPGTYN